MHARDLVDVALLISMHGQQLIPECPRLFDKSLADYWSASRCRLDRWCRGLKSIDQGAGSSACWSPDAIRLVEEIVVSEILTRTVATLFLAHDQYHDRDEADPLGRNILYGHIDARLRASQLITAGVQAGSQQAKQLHSLEQRCKRWNDLLLAYFVPLAPVHLFAWDTSRVYDFADDARQHLDSATAGPSASILLSASARLAFESLASGEAPCADLNQQIASALLGCFGPDFFDSHGLLRSTWLDRLQTVPDETLAMLDQWWEPHPKTVPPSLSWNRGPET